MGKVIVPENKKNIKLKDLLSISEPGSGVMRDPSLQYENDPAMKLQNAVKSLKSRKPSSNLDTTAQKVIPKTVDSNLDAPSLTEADLGLNNQANSISEKQPTDSLAPQIENISKIKQLFQKPEEAESGLLESLGLSSESGDTTEKDTGKMGSIWKQAMIPALTTGIGALFGGAEGGAIGARSGQEYFNTIKTLKEQDRAHGLEKIKSDLSLMSHGLKINPTTMSVEPDNNSPYWTEKAIEMQSKLAQIAAVFGKENAQKLADELSRIKLNQEKEIKTRELDIKEKEFVRKAQAASSSGPKISKDASVLRKEFQSTDQVKNFNKIQSSYENIKKAAQNPSAAGDLSLIFSYMKLLDPGSTVREGEFATAQNAAGIDSQIINIYNKARSGERLSPKQRQDFINNAQNQFDTFKSMYDETASKYKDIAEQYNVSPSLIFGREQKAPVSQQKKPAPTNTIVKKQYNPSLNKTRIIYADGTQEVLDGKK